MSDEQHWLKKGTLDLCEMMMGLDVELDDKLPKLSRYLESARVDRESFENQLQEIKESHFRFVDAASLHIQKYKHLFEALLNSSDQRLLAPLNQPEPRIGEVLALAEPLFNEIRGLAKNQVKGVTDEIQKDDVLVRMFDRFRSLVDTLSLISESKKDVIELNSLLDQEASWKTLDQLSEKAIDLLYEYLNEEKKQFEGYLSEINSKLTHINEIVESDAKALSELKEINLVFNTGIKKQLADARKQIETQDLGDENSDGLLVSLQSIAQSLKNYQISYNDNMIALQSNKAMMKEELLALEQENLRLLTQLHREREMSMSDTLTQLPNRHGFNARLTEELVRAHRHKYKLCIALLDIDFFKRINDDFGHLVGDKVLRMIAKEMKKVCRKSDFIARFGGEEFVILLPQTSLAHAVVATDKIRKHVEKCPFHYQNNPVPLTVSGGVSELLRSETTDEWINRADAALYDSKRNGRNRITGA